VGAALPGPHLWVSQEALPAPDHLPQQLVTHVEYFGLGRPFLPAKISCELQSHSTLIWHYFRTSSVPQVTGENILAGATKASQQT
jgi:hypothetical protein